MDQKTERWINNHKDCPWYIAVSRNEGECRGNVYYNRHINDPRYGSCDFYTCPFFFWINTFEEAIDNVDESLNSALSDTEIKHD